LNGSQTTAAAIGGESKSIAKQLRLKPVTSTQRKGMVWSRDKTLKRDNAKLVKRPNSQTVMAQMHKRLDDFNFYHPHNALGYLTAYRWLR
jgi:putative transposase